MDDSKTYQVSCSGSETLPGCPELCVSFHCEFFRRMNPSLGLLSIFIMFHHSQQEPDKQSQEMPCKVWWTKINAQTVVSRAELCWASLGWKTSKLVYSKITLVPREGSGWHGSARRGRRTGLDNPGLNMPREWNSHNAGVILNSFLLSLFASCLLLSLHLSAKPTLGGTKNSLGNPVFTELQGRAGEQMWAW